MEAGCLEVRELNPGYKTLVARQDIKSGTFLGDLWGPVLSSPTAHSSQIGANKHLTNVSQHRFGNHSCNQNAKLVYSQRSGAPVPTQDSWELGWHMVAIRDISKGEEVTNDYTLTEYDMAAPFQCNCGSKNCLGTVRGFKFLPEEEKEKRMPYVSPVIKELLKSEAGNHY